MRHEKVTKLLDLARRLASSSEGLTLDEMAQAIRAGQKRAEDEIDARMGDQRLAGDTAGLAQVNEAARGLGVPGA